ncbi:hypothetical protein HJD18_07435 [Thermoleophilia bacterium SCSIO 60948]|nr:hypothetical protein HJD18_07435 [Thermoleophilia bacterium SCSIO 60948]
MISLRDAGSSSASDGAGGRGFADRVKERVRAARAPRLPEPPGPDDGPRKPRLKKLRFALVFFGLSILAGIAWIFGIMMAVAQDLPSLETRAQYAASENSVVTDMSGERLAVLTNNEGRILLSTDEISPSIKDAVVAIEDQRFYEHRGVDFRGIGRAVVQDILAGSAEQGASTITQQFVKNALAAQDQRTIFQKLREASLAYQIERKWPKDKILTNYLNLIYFGEGATGVESAARTYFGYNHPGCGTEENPCASELLPWEAALLAGIISSPSGYSPRANPEAATDRRNQVLANMEEQGFITAEELEEYSAQPIPRAKDIQPPEDDSKAPYFTSWLRQQLVDRYGAGEAFGGGLEIQSTLDLDLQREVEGIVSERLAGIDPTAAVVVLDNETSAVRAMVGGSDYENEPFNLATNGQRQPGSSFKPFTLLTALEEGRSLDEVFVSEPKSIPFEAEVENKDGELVTKTVRFEPANYDDSYLGPVSLLDATTNSDNSVYAELGMQLGPKRIAETAHALGIDTELSTNPAMILGGLEQGVTPLEMAHAYESIAEDGRRTTGTLAADEGPVAMTQVLDENGNPVSDDSGATGENEVETTQAVPVEAAQTAREALATVVESGTGTNAATGIPTWGKTGTTDNNGDAWFCGATGDITACVWVGRPDSNEPMLTEYGGAPVDGGTFPALIFHDVVLAHQELEDARGKSDDEIEAEAAQQLETGAASEDEDDSASSSAAVVSPAP